MENAPMRRFPWFGTGSAGSCDPIGEITKVISPRVLRHLRASERSEEMISISVTQARSNLYQLLSAVNMNSEPVTLTNSRGKNGVLISEDDWNAIRETLYLNSVPGMTESILAADRDAEEGAIYDPEEAW